MAATNQFYKPTVLDFSKPVFQPNWQAWDQTYAAMEQEYDMLGTLADKMPEHIEADRAYLVEQAAGLNKEFDSLAELWANDPLAARRKTKEFTRNVLKRWQPGGDFYDISSRRKSYDENTKYLQEMYAKDPVLYKYAQQVGQDINPYNPELPSSSIGLSDRLAQPYTQAELLDRIGSGLSLVKDQILAQYPEIGEDQEALLRFTDLGSLSAIMSFGTEMGLDMSLAQAALDRMITDDVVAAAQFNREAYGMDPEVNEADWRTDDRTLIRQMLDNTLAAVDRKQTKWDNKIISPPKADSSGSDPASNPELAPYYDAARNQRVDNDEYKNLLDLKDWDKEKQAYITSTANNPIYTTTTPLSNLESTVPGLKEAAADPEIRQYMDAIEEELTGPTAKPVIKFLRGALFGTITNVPNKEVREFGIDVAEVMGQSSNPTAMVGMIVDKLRHKDYDGEAYRRMLNQLGEGTVNEMEAEVANLIEKAWLDYHIDLKDVDDFRELFSAIKNPDKETEGQILRNGLINHVGTYYAAPINDPNKATNAEYIRLDDGGLGIAVDSQVTIDLNGVINYLMNNPKYSESKAVTDLWDLITGDDDKVSLRHINKQLFKKGKINVDGDLYKALENVMKDADIKMELSNIGTANAEGQRTVEPVFTFNAKLVNRVDQETADRFGKDVLTTSDYRKMKEMQQSKAKYRKYRTKDQELFFTDQKVRLMAIDDMREDEQRLRILENQEYTNQLSDSDVIELNDLREKFGDVKGKSRDEIFKHYMDLATNRLWAAQQADEQRFAEQQEAAANQKKSSGVTNNAVKPFLSNDEKPVQVDDLVYRNETFTKEKMEGSPNAVTTVNESILNTYNNVKDYSYDLGAKGKNNEVDCSGFVCMALRDMGVDTASLPDQTSQGLWMSSKDKKQYTNPNQLDVNSLKPGTIIAFDTGEYDFDEGRKFGIDHIGMVVFEDGVPYFVESTSEKNGVVKSPLVGKLESMYKQGKLKKFFTGVYE